MKIINFNSAIVTCVTSILTPDINNQESICNFQIKVISKGQSPLI